MDVIDSTLPQKDALGFAIIDDGGPRPEVASPVLDDLQQAVLAMFASAHTDRDIADRLSVGTQDVHAAKMRGMQKSGLRARVQVVDCVRARRR
jgi:DNA-binding NarL/FixJ family response regulator